MNAIYPLFGIETENENPICISKGISVSKNDIDTEKLYTFNLSQEEKKHLQQTSHCLFVDKDLFVPEQASLLFIIACRLLKPTRVVIRYRIDTENNVVSKIRDDYPFVPSNQVTSKITDEDFTNVSKIFDGLNYFKTINTRTANASYFIGLAYRSRKWLEALIFHVCALETITSAADREQGITRKFVDRIYHFIGYDRTAIEKIYNIRSELVHGRYLAESIDNQLDYFMIAEEVCRFVFMKILMNKAILDSFSTDSERMMNFEG